MALQLPKDVKFVSLETFLSNDRHKLFMAFGNAGRQFLKGEISYPSTGSQRTQDMLVIVCRFSLPPAGSIARSHCPAPASALLGCATLARPNAT